MLITDSNLVIHKHPKGYLIQEKKKKWNSQVRWFGNSSYDLTGTSTTMITSQ